MDAHDMRAALRSAVEKAGGLRAFGRQIHVSPAHISDVLHGSREPGPKVLRPLGLEKFITRNVVYRRVGAARPHAESLSYGVRCHECGEYETVCRC